MECKIGRYHAHTSLALSLHILNGCNGEKMPYCCNWRS